MKSKSYLLPCFGKNTNTLMQCVKEFFAVLKSWVLLLKLISFKQCFVNSKNHENFCL